MILNLSESFGDTQIAVNRNSEIFTTSINSQIIKLKFDTLFERAHISRETISNFQKVALPNYKDLATIINNKERSFSDLIILLEKAERFRSWKKELDSESNFIEEYSKALSADGWFEKLPSKIGRFLIFEGIGVALDFMRAGGLGTTSAAALSAVDSFFLDRLLRDWKPNQFIKEEYKAFVK